MKSFRCRDAGVATCSAKVTGQTDDEVLAKAVAHAREAHGVDISQSRTLVRYAQSTLREEPSGSTSEGPGDEAQAGS